MYLAQDKQKCAESHNKKALPKIVSNNVKKIVYKIVLKIMSNIETIKPSQNHGKYETTVSAKNQWQCLA